MRLLVSRGALAGIILMVAVGIPHAAPAQRQLVAQSGPIALLVPGPVSEPPVPRRLPTLLAPPPTSTPQPRRVAIVAPRAKITPAPAPKVPARASAGTGQFGLINQDRQRAGLAPLQWSDCLASIATQQAARMAAQGYISHANGRTLDLGCHLGTRTGENIGFQGGSINDVAMNAWFMGDAPHRANILGPYHYVGVAWVWGGGTAYLAVEFG
jgi:uncharacterized protein YkwD